MKKLLFGIILWELVFVFPLPTKAEVHVGVNISLPVPIVFVAPPHLIVLPETDIYVVPDVEVDIFFYNGWWWRPWEGGWYRSRHYDSDWSYYQQVPSFYSRIPLVWRNEYRSHRWRGNQWNYVTIPHQQVQQNWGAWQKSKYWERHKSWGVEGLQPQMRSKQYRGTGRKSHKATPQHSQQQYHGGGQKSHKVHSQHQQGGQKGGKGGGKGHK